MFRKGLVKSYNQDHLIRRNNNSHFLRIPFTRLTCWVVAEPFVLQHPGFPLNLGFLDTRQPTPAAREHIKVLLVARRELNANSTITRSGGLIADHRSNLVSTWKIPAVYFSLSELPVKKHWVSETIYEAWFQLQTLLFLLWHTSLGLFRQIHLMELRSVRKFRPYNVTRLRASLNFSQFHLKIGKWDSSEEFEFYLKIQNRHIEKIQAG